MKISLPILCLLLGTLANAAVESCISDLNKDGFNDYITLNKNNLSLDVLLSSKKNIYSKYELYNGNLKYLKLWCKEGISIKETSVGNLNGKVHTVNGAYIVFGHEESSKRAFYWDGIKFIEVWIEG